MLYLQKMRNCKYFYLYADTECCSQFVLDFDKNITVNSSFSRKPNLKVINYCLLQISFHSILRINYGPSLSCSGFKTRRFCYRLKSTGSTLKYFKLFNKFLTSSVWVLLHLKIYQTASKLHISEVLFWIELATARFVRKRNDREEDRFWVEAVFKPNRYFHYEPVSARTLSNAVFYMLALYQSVQDYVKHGLYLKALSQVFWTH